MATSSLSIYRDLHDYTHLHIFLDTERPSICFCFWNKTLLSSSSQRKQMFIQIHAVMTILRSKLHSHTKTFAGHVIVNSRISDFIIFLSIGSQVKIPYHFNTTTTATVLFTHRYTWRNFGFKDRICILFFCHSHSHSHSHSALCNVYPVALDRNRR